MRVVHLTSAHPPFDVRIFHKECNTLAAAGHQVTLIAPHNRDEQVGNVAVRSVPGAGNRIVRMTLSTWRVYREALRQPADAYHFHDPELIPAALLLRAFGKKVVYDLHEDVPQDILGKDYLPKLIRRPLAMAVDGLERISGRCFSGLVAATPAIAERFSGLNGKLAVVQNFPLQGELIPQARRAWLERDMAVAYAGSITRDRGIREMTEAMGLVSCRLPARLKLAGTFWPSELRRRIAGLMGWNSVEEIGQLSRPKLGELLGQVRGGLLVFHPDPNNVRAQPNKLFEYMSAGIPVIASNFPVWREVIAGAGCGILVNPLRPSEIADAIEYVLSNPREAEEMGLRGQQAVEDRYQWSTEGARLLALYQRLDNRTCAG